MTSEQDQLDAKTPRYIAGNAEIEHTLLIPFCWMIRAGKAIMYTVLLAGWFVFTLFGWVVNVGEYSLENRREAICDARAYLNLCDTHQFERAYVPTVAKWSRANNTDVTIVRDAFRPNWDGGRVWFNPLRATSPEELDAAPKSWINLFGSRDFFKRSDGVFRRKSARMDCAIELGEVSTKRLRGLIADVKHINPERVRLVDMPLSDLNYYLTGATFSTRDHVSVGIRRTRSSVFGFCRHRDCVSLKFTSRQAQCITSCSRIPDIKKSLNQSRPWPVQAAKKASRSLAS
jgi:hypothetical protein